MGELKPTQAVAHSHDVAHIAAELLIHRDAVLAFQDALNQHRKGTNAQKSMFTECLDTHATAWTTPTRQMALQGNWDVERVVMIYFRRTAIFSPIHSSGSAKNHSKQRTGHRTAPLLAHRGFNSDMTPPGTPWSIALEHVPTSASPGSAAVARPPPAVPRSGAHDHPREVGDLLRVSGSAVGGPWLGSPKIKGNSLQTMAR